MPPSVEFSITDAVGDYEPILYNYGVMKLTPKTVTLRALVLAGSSDIQTQGFTYKVSHWSADSYYVGGSGQIMECTITRGFRHQIRVHLAGAGHPIVGDSKYGDRRVNRYFKEKFDLSTQLLHAARLEFECGDDIMKVTAPLPKKCAKIKEEIFKS